ncbi:hypothetical protein HDU78_008089 [Chytriomyces hyalinus]|nr:hypothetical protein HDU78_008089 [Chytriomyces hyalinus]
MDTNKEVRGPDDAGNDVDDDVYHDALGDEPTETETQLEPNQEAPVACDSPGPSTSSNPPRASPPVLSYSAAVALSLNNVHAKQVTAGPMALVLDPSDFDIDPVLSSDSGADAAAEVVCDDTQSVKSSSSIHSGRTRSQTHRRRQKMHKRSTSSSSSASSIANSTAQSSSESRASSKPRSNLKNESKTVHPSVAQINSSVSFSNRQPPSQLKANDTGSFVAAAPTPVAPISYSGILQANLIQSQPVANHQTKLNPPTRANSAPMFASSSSTFTALANSTANTKIDELNNNKNTINSVLDVHSNFGTLESQRNALQNTPPRCSSPGASSTTSSTANSKRSNNNKYLRQNSLPPSLVQSNEYHQLNRSNSKSRTHAQRLNSNEDSRRNTNLSTEKELNRPNSNGYKGGASRPGNNNSDRQGQQPIKIVHAKDVSLKFKPTGQLRFRYEFVAGLDLEVHLEDKCGSAVQLAENVEAGLNAEMYQIYETLIPSEVDVRKREEFIAKIQHLVNLEWPDKDIQVHPFGSTVNGLGSQSSDVDLCLTTPWKDHKRGISNMFVLANFFKKHGMVKVFTVSKAKVPICKFYDPE